MEATTPIVPDSYEYTAPDGKVYTGATAFVLNHLDSAEGALVDNFTDVREDTVFSDTEVMQEAELHSHLTWLLDHTAELAAYLG